MKAKLLPLIFLILLVAQGCVSASMEGQGMKEKTHLISDFTKITIDMTYDEVVRLIGDPTDSIGSGIVWQRYKLSDGWYAELLFVGEAERLMDIQFVDYHNNREFILKQNR